MQLRGSGVVEKAAKQMWRQSKQLRDELDGRPYPFDESEERELSEVEGVESAEQSSGIATPRVPIESLPHVSPDIFNNDERWRRPLIDRARNEGRVSVVPQPQNTLKVGRGVAPRASRNGLPQYRGRI